MLLAIATAVSLGGGQSLPKDGAPKPIPEVPIDHLPLDRARALDGEVVTGTLLVGKPPCVLDDRTLVGSPEVRVGDAERSAVLTGERYDLKEGRSTRVQGRSSCDVPRSCQPSGEPGRGRLRDRDGAG